MINAILGAFIAGLLIFVFGGAYGLVIVSKIRANYYKHDDEYDCGCDC